MKIICTQKEKDLLIEMFNDERAECPFNGECPSNCSTIKCSECIEKNLNIQWEVDN